MGILDSDYAIMIGAPGKFRDVAEQRLGDLQSALDSAIADRNTAQAQVATLTTQLQQAQDQAKTDALTIADLTGKLQQAQTDLATATANLATATSNLAAANVTITSLRAQLASASSTAPLGDIYIGRDLQKMNDPVTGWQPPQVSAAIGANPPAAYSRSWDAKGNLVLNTTGKAGQYSDWLTALHIPDVVKPTSRAAMIGWGFIVDGNQQFVQCLERDALFAINGGLLNGSFQFNASTGQAQIEKGPDPVTGKGAWMDAGIPVTRFAAGRHALEILYFLDQTAKTIQYAMIAVDGVRTLIPPATGIRKAFPPWAAGKLHLQAQEDANSQGGSFQTVFDSIWAVIL